MAKWLMVLSLLCLAHRARAAEDESTSKARIHLRAGIADYDEGRYTEAANEMEQAYALRPLPDLQYNLAQCYERLNRLEDAAKAYEVYLGGQVNAADRVLVGRRIENLRARAKAQTEGTTAPALPPQEKVVFKTLVVYREAPPPPGRAARWAAWAVGALGLAGIGTGIAFAVLTAKAGQEVHDQGNLMNPQPFNSATQDAAHLYPIGTGVGFAVGGLGVGGALGLYFASRKVDRDAAKQREHEQALLPTLAPFYARSGGASVSGIVAQGKF
jgi:tetratricopeptide (TPR) repeat protein